MADLEDARKTPAAGSGETDSLDPRTVPFRLAALVFLILAINAWLAGHLGVDLKSLLGVEAALALIAALRKPLRKGDQKQIDHLASKSLYFLLSDTFLILSALLTVIVMSLISSVTVVASGINNVGEVRLAPEASIAAAKEKLTRGEDVVRFVRFASPFGRPFYLAVAGHRRYSFVLYPVVPKIIRVNADLELTPSILIRVPYPHIDLVGGQIEVYRSDDQQRIASAPTTANSASLLLGTDVPVPESLIGGWQRQLSASQVSTNAQAAPIDAWMNPQRNSEFPAAGERHAGERLFALFKNEREKAAKRLDTYSATADFTIRDAPFQDVLLRPKAKEK